VTPAAVILLSATGGLAIGSFLNVCITRLPEGESVVTPGSRCRSCRTAIGWFDNIPVVSYVLLAGRCRRCRAPIGVRYPLVEITTAAGFALQAWTFWPDVPTLLSRLLFAALLIALFWTDLETERLPNALTIPGTAAGVLAGLFAPPGPVASLLGAAVGAGLLLLVRWGWHRATGVEGMGLGDVKMLAMIGAFLGWQQVFVVLFLASLAGAIVGIVLITVRRGSLQSHLPFGTFLAAAALMASVTGESIASAYVQSLP
jgi:leader peptidase (prepilin peptidase)/N-methyltransferase